MTTTHAASNPIVVLDVPRAVAPLTALALVLVQTLTDNKATFTSPSPALAQVTTDTNALSTAQADVKSKKGTVQTRDEKRSTLIADLHQLRAYVQILVSANPEHAAVIAAAAGMSLRKPATRTKNDLTVTPHTTGAVRLIARAAASRVSNEWQYSFDNKTWMSAPPSLQSKTTIGNLQTGVLTYFRHRAVTKTGPGDWSQPVSALVP